MTKALKLINICIFIVWEKGQWKTGQFQGRRDTLFSGKRDILPSGNNFFPLGIGPLILWKTDHFSSIIREILWERDMGIGTRYPLGFRPLIIWESGLWEMRFNHLYVFIALW